jgi:hypothetical protein
MSEENDEDSQQEYGLVEPFDIDNGELDGVRPQQAFVLGYEICQLHNLLDGGPSPISRPVHAENESRIKRLCIRRRRKCRLAPNGPEWLWLEIAGADGAFRETEARP